MINQVSFDLGAAQTLQLLQTGPDTASLGYEGTNYSLASIVVGQDQLTCVIVGLFGIKEAQITVSWAHDVLTLTISKSWDASADGTKTIQLTAAQMAEWTTFLKTAAFSTA